MTDRHVHASHPAIVKRLKRAEGHLRSVVAMIETSRTCLEIAQQLHAVESAVAEAKRTLIRDHLDHCLGAAIETLPEAQRSAVAAFRDITRYL
jgi:DNA-binding FrmR family transcriptional regulator